MPPWTERLDKGISNMTIRKPNSRLTPDSGRWKGACGEIGQREGEPEGAAPHEVALPCSVRDTLTVKTFVHSKILARTIAGLAAALVMHGADALAQGPTRIGGNTAAPAATAWSDANPAVAADLSAGKPLVIHVIVPLCARAYAHCGGGAKSDPADLDGNLYWGAIFGARRVFEGTNSPWRRVSSRRPSGDVLEHLVYRRMVSGRSFGASGEVEQLVSLEAWNGGATDQAIEQFWKLATEGGEISYDAGAGVQTARIHAVGYAGYNRLMDDMKLPAPPSSQARPIPSFVFARDSELTFGDALRRARSFPLSTTRGTMAPEGYVIDEAARSLGDNNSPRMLRARLIETYKRWQRAQGAEASFTFAQPHP